MNPTHLALAASVVLLAGTHGQSSNSGADAIPPLPVATFSTNPEVVQTGTYPELVWSIIYPSAISDVATITPPGSVTLTKPMFLSIRPVGIGVTRNGRGQNTSEIHAEARLSIDGAPYDQLFYGTNADVDPSYALYIKKLSSGTTVDFGGRYVVDEQWTPFYTSRSINQQVVTLVDGDMIPATYSLHESPNFASYLDPYVDGTGKVDIGPLSMLVLMELAEVDHASPNFDYQDVVLLVSLSHKHPNNGHGNNLDGVDSSNPGEGRGGPNGEVDPSSGHDDEIR